MTTVFDPQKHLTSADDVRLAKVAKSQGLKPGEFIEILIKRAIFAPQPADKKKGVSK